MALFQPLESFGAGPLRHRIVMAPLTRNRASVPGHAPLQRAVDYYSQRASSGGLLISEATNISPESLGYAQAPGIWTQEQVEGWRQVTTAVHRSGCKIFCQLWHIGRVSHPSWREHVLCEGTDYTPCVSASDVAMKGNTTNSIDESKVKNMAPRSLRTEEIPRLVSDYVRAAKNAIEAGFDGVEVHAAHGYLIDQFLNNGTNQRTDEYGGSIENRCRLLFQVLGAVCEVVGSGRCAVRLSPTYKGSMSFFQVSDSEPELLYEHAVAGLNRFPLAYLLLTEARWVPKFDNDVARDPGYGMEVRNVKKYRPLYKGVLMAAGGFTAQNAAKVLAEGHADLIAFGRFFLANPDFVERVRTGADLNIYHRPTFYTHDEEGYTDYPSMDGSVSASGKYKTISPGDIGAQAKL